MTTNIYARAYARGLNADLVAAGTVVYPSKIAMDIASDAIAEHVLAGQNFLRMTGVPTKLAADAVSGFIAISDDLCKQAGGASPELTKAASASNGVEVARYEALQLLKEAEAEARNPTMTEPASTGSEKNPVMTNTAPNASPTGEAASAPTKADGADGVPEVAVTGTEHAIGGHGTTPANSKLASFARRMTAKIAATGSNPKSVESSPKTEQSATGEPSKIVSKENPGEGVPAKAEEGAEMAQKTASYLARVEKIASAAVPYLPGDLPEYAQIAHVRALSKFASASDQGKYMYFMYNAYGMPEADALKYASEYVKRASDMEAGDDDDDDDKDDDKDDGSSDKAIAEALDAAAGEIEEGKKEEESADAAKMASVDRLRNTVQA